MTSMVCAMVSCLVFSVMTGLFVVLSAVTGPFVVSFAAVTFETVLIGWTAVLALTNCCRSIFSGDIAGSTSKLCGSLIPTKMRTIKQNANTKGVSKTRHYVAFTRSL